MLSDVGGWGVASVLDVQSLFFFIKEHRICPMTRHHVEPNTNILFTRNLSIDSGVKQWSHPLMIPLQCQWAKSNNTTRGQFQCDVTQFLFCSFTYTVRLLHHSWRGGVRLKLDVQGQGDEMILDIVGQGADGALKIRQFSWTSYVYRPLRRLLS